MNETAIVEDAQASAEEGALLQEAMGFGLDLDVEMPPGVDLPSGIRLPAGIALNSAGASFFGLPDGTQISLARGYNYDHANWYYLVIVPSGEDIFDILSFNLNPAFAAFGMGFMLLAGLELLMILFGVFGIRRSTKKILRPINELTAVAQIMNSSPIMTKPVKQPKPQELKLSGAIKTLNTITEDRLDTRIAIDDEREELKGLASAINNMLDRLDAAYQAQLRFVSDASHELRTPISVIQGYANLLDRWGKRDEKALQESIDAIKSEAEGMESLVEQLLFLARSDNNTVKMEMDVINLSLLVEEIVKETDMIDETHAVSGAVEPDLMVYGDGQLIKQAVRIFVDNARKYTPDDGRVRIAAERKGAEVRVSVTDTGLGIADKDLSHVFERFFRADESRARKTGGTGLGLSIAKWIVDRHGGYLEILSRENIGTRITAVFPNRATGTPPLTVAPPPPPPEPPEVEADDGAEKNDDFQRPEAV
jgi:signal transduction histidine kinase